MKIDHLIENKIVQNIFVWTCLFFILSVTVQGGNKIATGIGGILILAPSIYVQNLFIQPILKKNKLIYAFFSCLNLIFFTVLGNLSLTYAYDEKLELDWNLFLNFIGIQAIAISCGVAVKIARDSFIRRHKDKEAELQLLKAQLNPHFLFNTLNNLYGLSVSKSEKLPKLMLQLSDLLRYSLYDTQESQVPLEKEVEYLKNYVSLEAIRLDNLQLDFKLEGNISKHLIPPMMFIVFIENAFKHLNEKKEVNISIKTENEQICFRCENSYSDRKLDNLEKGKSGIGLVNVKKRLALIYPNKHQLFIQKDNGCFSVELTIDTI